MQDSTKSKEKSRQATERREGARPPVLSRGVRNLLEGILWGCCAWLFGQAPMLFDTYPLGLALLCASTRHLPALFLGLIASAFWQMRDPLIYICAYSVAALVRLAVELVFENGQSRRALSQKAKKRMQECQPVFAAAQASAGQLQPGSERKGGRGTALRQTFFTLFCESLCLRMCTGAVCVFIVALYRIIVGGFRYYDFFAALFLLAVTPLAVLLYSVSLGKREAARVLYEISRAALLFSLIWAANGISVAGLPLAVMLALFFTLYVCRSEGPMLGVVASILCGVAYDPFYAPAFLLAALVYLLFGTLRREKTGVAMASVTPLLWWGYVGEPLAILPILPASLVAGTAFTLYGTLFANGAAEADTPDDSCVRLRMEGTRRQDANERFRGISDAFSSLSEMFYNLSDRFRRPGTLDLRRICDGSFDAFCNDCPNKTVCWGLEYSNTLGTLNSLIAALHTRGKVSRAQIPPALQHRCESVDAILETVNRECAKLTGELLRNNRTEIFAMDYESAANIINDALEEDDGEYRFDPALEQRIAEYLKDAYVRAHGVTVYGTRRRQIVVRGVDVEQATVTVETLRSDLGELCGMELSRPTFEVEGKVSTMTLQAKKKIAVEGAQNNVSADGGVSGDSLNLFSNKKDYFYALISDGMGAGREAALTSGLCSVFLEKMLRAGNRAGTSLRMLNNMIRSRSADSARECSSTVDLMELDLMTGMASFIKSGAAPSFVVRGKVVHRLQAGTAPIGIICALDVQSTPFSLKAGDTVVMISDGILQDDPDCAWITSYLSGVSGLSPDEIVYRICLHAAQSDKHDDCSAIALRIRNAEGA
ncbi:MAG: SpoIIE family protein phosphatase [Clostridia bacterium]|nr:SpoIIE family protein phosphatase [Clostridia bacterium]